MVFDRLTPAVLFRHSPQVRDCYCMFGARAKAKNGWIKDRIRAIGKFLLNRTGRAARMAREPEVNLNVRGVETVFGGVPERHPLRYGPKRSRN
jgi:hypothetical protein